MRRDQKYSTLINVHVGAHEQTQTQTHANQKVGSSGNTLSSTHVEPEISQHVGIKELASSAVSYLGNMLGRIQGQGSGTGDAQALAAVLRSDMTGLQQFEGASGQSTYSLNSKDTRPEAAIPRSNDMAHAAQSHTKSEDERKKGLHPSLSSMERRLRAWEEKKRAGQVQGESKMVRNPTALASTSGPRRVAVVKKPEYASVMSGKQLQQVAACEFANMCVCVCACVCVCVCVCVCMQAL
jgi:hypothetical protein